MVKPEFIGIGAIALLLILTYPFVFAGTSGSITVNGSDSNQVKVTTNDTTPGYLSDKLDAGSNITLTIQNPGADENILISATGSGFDTNCSATNSCPNIVYQNQDANLNNIRFKGTISGGDFNYSLSDANDSQSCPAGQALQSVGATITCVDINATSSDGNGSILGTSNQVNVTNGLSRLFGDANVVLSLPQNIDTSSSPQFVGLNLTPCSTFQMDTSPQLRFKVDCGASTVSSTTFIPVVSGTTDIGNTSNVWDDFWIQDINARNDINSQNLRIYGSAKIRNLSVDDLNASCADLNDGCLTQTDGNGLYVLKNPVSTQIINPFPNTLANPLDVNGNLRPLVTQVSNLGANGRRWNDVFAVRYVAVASTGQPSLVIQSNTGAYCVSGTDTCMDFNGQIRAVTLSDNNIMYHGWGMTGSAFGLYYHYPSSTEPTFQAPLVTPDGTMWNKKTNGLIQPMVFYRGKMNEVGSNLLDLNVTNDLNVSGDGNFHQNVKVDSNIFGQLISPGNLVGVSCNTTCGAYSYAGPWVCVEATNITGASSTCSDATVAHNCLCRN